MTGDLITDRIIQGRFPAAYLLVAFNIFNFGKRTGSRKVKHNTVLTYYDIT